MTAVTAMVDANLQREHILPSEKAFAYKIKMEAMSHQGTTCGQLGHKSRDAVSDDESGRQIQRYIRLTYLIPEILQQVDEGRIAFNPAVELSYLTEGEQQVLLDSMERNDCTPSHVEFESVTEKFDTSTPSGRAMLNIIMAFAQLERETIAERVRDNYYHRFALGGWPGGPAPLGFDIGRITDSTGRHDYYLPGLCGAHCGDAGRGKRSERRGPGGFRRARRVNFLLKRLLYLRQKG